MLQTVFLWKLVLHLKTSHKFLYPTPWWICMFQDKKSVFYFGNSSIMHSLRPRERINDLWVVTYPKKNTATHKTWTQTFSAKFRDIHMYMLVRLSHRCCLAQQSNGSKSCLHVWWPLCFLYITKKKALHFKEKEMISLRKAEFVTKWDETVLSNTNLNQP